MEEEVMKRFSFFSVLLASLFLLASGVSADSHKVKEMDIVETAVSAENFTTLVAAVQAAGLVEALKGEGPFTVFAPTDDAFAKLPEGTVEALLADKEKLTAVLTYHVVPGKVMAADVVKVEKAKTLNGQEVAVKVSEETVMIDNAKVVATDIMASNGVIHVIDTVILPAMDKTDAKQTGTKTMSGCGN
jgi:uncharacterized surface protein with fasciclin (FAS1) repeats